MSMLLGQADAGQCPLVHPKRFEVADFSSVSASMEGPWRLEGVFAIRDESSRRLQPWDGFATADELIAYYAERSPRDMSRFHWYVVLACYKFGIILEGTYARACAGQAPVETGERLHRSALGLFKRAVEWIERG